MSRTVSRYDREDAFFDAVHDWGARHPVLDLVGAWLFVTVLCAGFVVGPLFGIGLLSLFRHFDPHSWADTVLVFGVGSGLLAAVVVVVADVCSRTHR